MCVSSPRRHRTASCHPRRSGRDEGMPTAPETDRAAPSSPSRTRSRPNLVPIPAPDTNGKAPNPGSRNDPSQRWHHAGEPERPRPPLRACGPDHPTSSHNTLLRDQRSTGMPNCSARPAADDERCETHHHVETSVEYFRRAAVFDTSSVATILDQVRAHCDRSAPSRRSSRLRCPAARQVCR